MVVDYTNAKIFVKGTEIFGATENSVTITANTTFDKNVHVSGNLTVDGENVNIATTQLTVEEPLLPSTKANMNAMQTILVLKLKVQCHCFFVPVQQWWIRPNCRFKLCSFCSYSCFFDRQF